MNTPVTRTPAQQQPPRPAVSFARMLVLAQRRFRQQQRDPLP